MPIGKPNAVPPISREFVEWLRKTRPLRMPVVEMTDREIWKEVGIQELIDWIEYNMVMQEADELPPPQP